MRALFLLVSLFFLSPLATAKVDTCFPQNTLYISTSINATVNAINKTSFDQAIDLVLNHYGPIVKAELGCDLVFNRLWSDGTVNSDTDVEGTNCVVNSYGGLARYKGMDTVAAYAAVACHEVGHHMGGAPRFTGDDWASVEGEADYWATKECMKGIGFSTKDIEAASQALANVLADLGGESVPAANKPDASVVQQTYEDHPAAQCRLDTYLSGLACQAAGSMSPTDPKVNSCFGYPTATTYSAGDRPRCWFAP